MTLPTVDVCCNDPANGLFTGRAERIAVGSFEVEALRRAPRIVVAGGSIRIAGRIWPIDGRKDWVGNWCWNAYRLKPSECWATPRWQIAKFLIWLRGRRLYGIDGGPKVLCDWWDSERELTPAEVHREVCDLFPAPTDGDDNG